MAAVAYLRQSNAFMLCSGAGATALSMEDTKLPYFFRCSINTIAIHRTSGDWYSKNVAMEAPLTATDFVGGGDTLAIFHFRSTPDGGNIHEKLFHPMENQN